MTPRHKEIELLVQQALDLPEHQRPAFIASCADDASLRAAVDRLVRVESVALDRFLTSPAFVAPVEDVAGMPDEAIPRRVGRYEILRKLGEGGMGAVYEARQENPDRTVALKVIRSGAVSFELLRRFQREANLLGKLSHPGIAHIYEAGIAEVDYGDDSGTRQPFLAMELVRGLPLGQFAAGRKLTVPETLELVARICDAVHHAHSHGIIHRDLKPANIFVVEPKQATGTLPGETPEAPSRTLLHNVQALATPKILDFGVARATNADLHTMTLQTHLGQLIGTVPYMSPEQVLGDSRQVDARSDVYALGVMLYELLAGRLPYDLRERSIPEAARIIREEEPSRLSAINAELRGDIETIVSKSLEKDKERRYQSAADLAADLRRFLRNEPIVARPVTAIYQLRKFAQRNRGLVAGILTAFVVLLVGLATSIALAIRAEHQRQIAADAGVRTERQAYVANVAAASAALRAGDVEDARARLDAAPVKLRGWEWRHLAGQLDESLWRMTSPNGELHWAMFAKTPNEVVFLEAGPSGPSDSGIVRRWRPLAGTVEIAYLIPPGAMYWRLGDRLAFYTPGSTDWQTYSLANGQQSRIGDALERCEIPPDAPIIAISPDERLVVARGNGQLMLVDLATAASTPLFALERSLSTLAVFSENGEFLAISTTSPEIGFTVFRSNGELVREVADHAEWIQSLAFSPDNRWVATASADRFLRLFSTTGAETPPWSIAEGHGDKILDVTFSPSGRLIATASQERSVRTWDAAKGLPRQVFFGHEGAAATVAFSPDESLLVSTGWDRAVRVWDLLNTDQINVLSGHRLFINDVALSDDGSLIASCGWDGRVCVWHGPSNRLLATYEPGHASAPIIAGVTFGQFSATLHFALRWSGGTGKPSATRWIEVQPRTGKVIRDVLLPVPDTRGLVQDLHRNRILLTGQNGTVFDATDPTRPLFRFEGAAALSDDGLDLFTIRDANLVSRLRAADGGPVASWRLSERNLEQLAVDSKRRRVIVAGDQGRLLVLDYEGNSIATMAGHTEPVHAIAISPDFQRIATGSEDRSIRIWDAETYTEVAQLRGHYDHIPALAFTPDGRRLYSGSADYTLRVWSDEPIGARLQSGREWQARFDRLRPLVQQIVAETDDLATAEGQLATDPRIPLEDREAAAILLIEHSAAAINSQLDGGPRE